MEIPDPPAQANQTALEFVTRVLADRLLPPELRQAVRVVLERDEFVFYLGAPDRPWPAHRAARLDALVEQVLDLDAANSGLVSRVCRAALRDAAARARLSSGAPAGGAHCTEVSS